MCRAQLANLEKGKPYRWQKGRSGNPLGRRVKNLRRETEPQGRITVGLLDWNCHQPVENSEPSDFEG
jgi:hypothetical protein